MAFFVLDLKQEFQIQFSKSTILNFNESKKFLLISILCEEPEITIKSIILDKQSGKFKVWSQHSRFASIATFGEQEIIFKINSNLKNFHVESFRLDAHDLTVHSLNDFKDFELAFRNRKILYTKLQNNTFLVAYEQRSSHAKSTGYLGYKLTPEGLFKCLDVCDRTVPQLLANCFRMRLTWCTSLSSCLDELHPNGPKGVSVLVQNKLTGQAFLCSPFISSSLKLKLLWMSVFNSALSANTLFVLTGKSNLRLEAVDLASLKIKNRVELASSRLDFTQAKVAELSTCGDDLLLCLSHSRTCHVFADDLRLRRCLRFPRYLSHSLLLGGFQVHFNHVDRQLKLIRVKEFYEHRNETLSKSSNVSKLVDLLDLDKKPLFAVHHVQSLVDKISQINLTGQKLDVVLNTVGLDQIEIDLFEQNSVKSRQICIDNKSIQSKKAYPFGIVRVDLDSFSTRMNHFGLAEMPSLSRNLRYYGWDYYLFLATARPLNYSLSLSLADSVHYSSLSTSSTQVAERLDSKRLISNANIYESYVFRPPYGKTISSYVFNSTRELEKSKIVNAEVVKGECAGLTRRCQERALAEHRV